jgi:hypothetical protein
LLAFPGVPRIFPADAALGLSARIIGEKNTAVNRIFGRLLSANRYSLTNHDPETIHILSRLGGVGAARRNPERSEGSRQTKASHITRMSFRKMLRERKLVRELFYTYRHPDGR